MDSNSGGSMRCPVLGVETPSLSLTVHSSTEAIARTISYQGHTCFLSWGQGAGFSCGPRSRENTVAAHGPTFVARCHGGPRRRRYACGRACPSVGRAGSRPLPTT